MDPKSIKYGLIGLVVLFVIVLIWDVYEFSQVPAAQDVESNSSIATLRLVLFCVLSLLLGALVFLLVFTYGDLTKSKLGALVNRVDTSDRIAPWTYGAGALMASRARRGALPASAAR